MSRIKFITGKKLHMPDLYLILVILYRVFLDWSYSEIFVKNYDYFNFINKATTHSRIASWAILLLFTVMVRNCYKNQVFSKEILYLLFLISVVPFTTMIAFHQFTMGYIFWNSVYWFILFLADNILTHLKKFRNIQINMRKISSAKMLKIVAVISFAVVLYISSRYTGFRFYFSFRGTYDLRVEAKEFNMPALLRYAFSWTRAINPILLAYFMRSKQHVFTGLCVLVQLLSFGINGMKSTLFFMAIVIGVNLLPRFWISRMNQFILFGMTGLGVVSYLEYALRGTYYIASLIIMRVMFLPNLISFYYYDFFSTHTPDYFRASILRFAGAKTPYPDLQHLIGNLYFHSEAMGSNDGLIADALTNFGLPGIFIMPVVLVLSFKLLDRVAEGLDEKICIIEAAILTLTLISNFFTSILLTNGLILVMLLLKMIKKPSFTDHKIRFAPKHLKWSGR